MNCLAVLLACCCQDPSRPAVPQVAPLAHDVIVLKNGDELQGRITSESTAYVELELEPGAVVGFTTTQVATIRRGAVAPPRGNTMVPARAEWFVLHDATGQPVGWLATSVVHRADGGFTVNEEYEFRDGARRYQVTALATAAPDLTPVSAYFRERVTEPVLALARLPVADPFAQHDRVVDERIVEATCAGDALHVQRLDRTGRRERRVPLPAGATFPLLARTLARASGRALGPVTLFDCATEELAVRSYDGSRRRSVVVDGGTVRVTEVAETGPTGRNTEWVDLDARTLRRELAGPALVALPSSSTLARGTLGGAVAPAIVATSDLAFGLWVPNPAWAAAPDQPAGQLALGNAAHGASISLSRLDHLEPGTPLDVAADAVANWFSLLQPGLRVIGRDAGTVRDRATVQLRAEGACGGIPTRATVDVLAHREHFLVLVCTAPVRAWDELTEDFDFLRRSVELETQAFAPRLQGPLAERPAKGARANGRTPVAPASASRRVGRGGVVRIPHGS
jgi:hypothetical protein